MQRPVMDPTYVKDDAPAPAWADGRGPGLSGLRRGWRQIKRLVRALFGLLMIDLMPDTIRRRLRFDEGTPFGRFCRAVLYRLAFAPILLVLIVATMVFTATHPFAVGIDLDPGSEAVYYEPVNFLSEDGTRSEAWLIPALDARRVLELKDKGGVERRQPAVLLVHDFANGKQQMLPLVRPLHDAGMVVMIVGLRGSGTTLPAAQTFGLNESLDVLAAAEVLRRRPYVDPDRVGVVGVGTGATATLIAAQRDQGLKALVLDDPARSADDVVARRIAPQHPSLWWMRPVCKWSFEIAFGIDAEDLELRRFTKLMSTRPVLMLDSSGSKSAGVMRPRQIEQVTAFLQKHLGNDVGATASAGSFIQR